VFIYASYSFDRQVSLKQQSSLLWDRLDAPAQQCFEIAWVPVFRVSAQTDQITAVPVSAKSDAVHGGNHFGALGESSGVGCIRSR
jgi:hypothetical protein